MKLPRIHAIMSGQAKDPLAIALRIMTQLVSPIYAVCTNHNIRKKQIRHLPCTTISVGNLTTGGTGKTPVVAWICRQLIAQDMKPCVLMRGYGSKNSGGSDEAKELRALLGPDVPIITNPNRFSGAQQAMKQCAGNPPNIFVLDDGYQHVQVERDLNICLIDGTNPNGYGHCLPRGMLREPMRALDRAEAVIITRCEQLSKEQLSDAEFIVAKYWDASATALASHEWVAIKQGTMRHAGTSHLDNKNIWLTCGIGNPNAFKLQVAQHANIAGEIIQNDHYAWQAEDIKKLFELAQNAQADAIVTTEKDWVKIEPLLDHTTDQIPILRPEVGIGFMRGEAALRGIIHRTIGLHGPSNMPTSHAQYTEECIEGATP